MLNIKHGVVPEELLSHPFCNKNMIEDKDTSDLLKCNDIICFIVGGTRFQIMKSKFAYWPETRLSKLIRAETQNEILKLCDKYFVSNERKTTMKTYIFFRNGSNFNSILDKYCVLQFPFYLILI